MYCISWPRIAAPNTIAQIIAQNYLMLGRDVRTSLEICYGMMPVEKLPNTYDDYATEMAERMRYAHATVREHLRQAADRYKYYYDLRVKPQKFKEGDKVLYFNPRRYQGRQEKWARKYTGPYTILKVTGLCNVQLQKTHRTKQFLVHVETRTA